MTDADRTADETEEFLGFTVEWTGNDAAPAIFLGRRGAVYGAIRYCGPGGPSEDCYLIDGGPRSSGVMRRIRGNATLTIPLGSRTITGAR